MNHKKALDKLTKWYRRAEEALTREQAQKAIRKAEKFQRKLEQQEDQ